jgi:hypothetical protein
MYGEVRGGERLKEVSGGGVGDAVYLGEDGEGDMGRASSLFIILTKSPRLMRS